MFPLNKQADSRQTRQDKTAAVAAMGVVVLSISPAHTGDGQGRRFTSRITHVQKQTQFKTEKLSSEQ